MTGRSHPASSSQDLRALNVAGIIGPVKAGFGRVDSDRRGRVQSLELTILTAMKDKQLHRSREHRSAFVAGLVTAALCLLPNPEAAVLASDSEAPAQAPEPEVAAANETEEESGKKRPIVHLLEMHTVSTEQEMIDLTAGRTLDRRQIELVAGRVSARRECFY